jgi:predicted DCC family thiol-disulfide oxidoreductase YuxK
MKNNARATLADGPLLVVFDGRCGLCNHVVRWLLRRDRAGRLRFVAAESEAGSEWLVRSGSARQGLTPESIVVMAGADSTDERFFTHTDAVLAVLRVLPGVWPWFARGARLVPRPLRDVAYRMVARYRYRIWGKLERCPLPTAAEKERFL